MEDEAILIYLKANSDADDEEIKIRMKAIRFFKGKLSHDELEEYRESLERF